MLQYLHEALLKEVCFLHFIATNNKCLIFGFPDDPFNPDFHNTPSSSPPDPRDSVSPSEREMPTPTANNILNGVPAHLQIAALTTPMLQTPANLQGMFLAFVRYNLDNFFCYSLTRSYKHD